MIRKIFAIVKPIVLAASLALPSPASADIETDMKDFWDGLGGGANITRPNAFEGQRAGYATLGSLYVRSSVRNANIVSLQLPSLKAGCGGIDIFAGSFSFLSKDELIALSKAIAANAAGFAFQLALESIAPGVAETMSNLRDLANEINSTNISSCEAAAGLVGSAWAKTERTSELICKAIGNSDGLFQDWAEGKHECSTGGKEKETVDNGDEKFTDQIPVNINYAWKAAKKNAFLASQNELSEIFMAMTGTIIVRQRPNEELRRDVKPPKAYSAATLRALVEGGDMPSYDCNEFTLCLQPTNGTVTIDADKSFFHYVLLIITQLSEDIRTDSSAVSPEAIALLNLTDLPIRRALVVAHAYKHHFYEDEILAMAEAVAMDAAYNYLRDLSEAMTNGGGNLGVAGDDLKEFNRTTAQTLRAMRELQRAGRDSFNDALASLERLVISEKALAASGGSIFVNQLRANP